MNYLIKNLKTLVLLTLLQASGLAFAESLNKMKTLESGDVFTFKSKILHEEREIYLSLPENYDHSNHKYPIVVVLDAEYLFPLANSIVKHQASRNYMPESIVIGIPNSTDKRMEMAIQIYDDNGNPFFFGENIGNASKYLNFFEKELFPSLEKKYRINTHRTIIGMSPTFGPVVEAFWNKPDLFSGYIVLAAEIGKRLKTGETVADKLLNSFRASDRKKSAIYVGTSSKDIIRRGESEAAVYKKINTEAPNKKFKNVNYKFEIVPDEDHYGMAITGIHNGLRTIYPKELWDIDYRSFWRSENPTQALKDTYSSLSNEYGFEIAPIESAFYSINNLAKTAEILGRQQRNEELQSWLKMALGYYPNSSKLLDMQKQLNGKSTRLK